MSSAIRKGKVLIVGKVPPPIGGVTVHVQRLLSSYREKNSHDFYDLSNFTVAGFIREFVQYKTLHLHTSSSIFRLLVALLSFITRKNLIITFHGNIGRYGRVRNTFDLLSVQLCSKPILLNIGSYNKAIGYNLNSELVTGFIPPPDTTRLPTKYIDEIKKLRDGGIRVFSTNAFNVSTDKYGRETYGISELLDSFADLANSRLIVSDPSGRYKKFIENKFSHLVEVPLWIAEPHDFIEVLKLSHGFIRNTTTDGDSLSVREALFYNVPVFASTAVERPAGCILFSNCDELLRQIELFSPGNHRFEPKIESSIERLDSIYNIYLSKK